MGSAQRRRLGVWGTKAAQSTLKLLNCTPDSSYPHLTCAKENEGCPGPNPPVLCAAPLRDLGSARGLAQPGSFGFRPGAQKQPAAPFKDRDATWRALSPKSYSHKNQHQATSNMQSNQQWEVGPFSFFTGLREPVKSLWPQTWRNRDGKEEAFQRPALPAYRGLTGCHACSQASCPLGLHPHL